MERCEVASQLNLSHCKNFLYNKTAEKGRRLKVSEAVACDILSSQIENNFLFSRNVDINP